MKTPLAVVSSDKDSVAAIHSGSLHLSERPGPARRREPPPPIRSGPLHPTRQGPSPSASPWWASRPRHVSFRGIMPPHVRGRGLDMSVWMSPPTPRNADAVRDACRLRHSDLRPRPGRSSRGRGPSPGTPLSRQFGVSSSLLLPLKTIREDNSVSVHHYCFPCIKSVGRQFGVSSSLLLPLHQVGKLDSWEDFQDRQAMTLFTTRSTAGTTEPMSSAPRANGICSLANSPAPRHDTLSHSSATA